MGKRPVSDIFFLKIVNRDTRRYSTSLIIRETQIKIKMRCHFIPFGIAVIKMTRQQVSVRTVRTHRKRQLTEWRKILKNEETDEINFQNTKTGQ